MKTTIILLIATLFAGIICKGQIALEKNYSAVDEFQIIHLNYSGDKYAVIASSDLIRMYNLDHSFWKSIDLEELNCSVVVENISENVFTTDNQLSVLLTAYYYNDNVPYTTLIINEDSEIFFCAENYIPNYPALVNTSDGLKLQLISADNGRHARIYSVPGTITATEKISELNELSLFSFPNPARNIVTIEYSLPQGENMGTILLMSSTGQEIKSYQVDKTFSNLKLDTSSLHPGIYFWQLNAGKHQTTKKMIVVN